MYHKWAKLWEGVWATPECQMERQHCATSKPSRCPSSFLAWGTILRLVWLHPQWCVCACTCVLMCYLTKLGLSSLTWSVGNAVGNASYLTAPKVPNASALNLHTLSSLAEKNQQISTQLSKVNRRHSSVFFYVSLGFSEPQYLTGEKNPSCPPNIIPRWVRCMQIPQWRGPTLKNDCDDI